MSAVTTRQPAGPAYKDTFAAGAANMQRGLALVQGGSDGVAAQAAAANASAFGIQEEGTAYAGDPLSAVLHGETVGIAGAAVNAGQYVITDAQGRLVPTAASGDNVVGRALSSAAVANDEFLVFVNPFIR